MIAFYQKQRNDGEPFKDFVARVGPETFEPILEDFKNIPELDRENIDAYMDWEKTVIYKLERGEGECAV